MVQFVALFRKGVPCVLIVCTFGGGDVLGGWCKFGKISSWKQPKLLNLCIATSPSLSLRLYYCPVLSFIFCLFFSTSFRSFYLAFFSIDPDYCRLRVAGFSDTLTPPFFFDPERTENSSCLQFS
jgi:hypothetical protein